MRVRPRWRREIGVLGLVLAVVASVVFAALRADERTSVRAETNDGGAWLVRRSDGVVGHMNRAIGEVSGVVRVADPLASFDVEQADDIVVVIDRSVRQLSLIDGRTFQTTNVIELPDDVSVTARPSGAILARTDPLTVWDVDVAELASKTSIDDIAPVLALESPGLVTMTRDVDRGSGVLALDLAGGQLHRTPDDPTLVALEAIGPPIDSAPIDALRDAVEAGEIPVVSAAGDKMLVSATSGLVAVDAEGAMALDGPPDDDSVAPEADGPAPLVVQQQAPSTTDAVVAHADGSVERVDLTGGENDPVTFTDVGTIGAADPLAPIDFGGCVFAVGLTPPTYRKFCGDEAGPTVALTGADPTSLRLRLVNGWVWINDLLSGSMWVASPETDLERIDDWGSGFGDADTTPDAEQASDEQSDEAEDRENPDVGEIRGQEIDEDGVNEPPVARDDEARTRVERPVLVDVMRNDEDPDGDALMVSDVTDVPDGLTVSLTADQQSIQVTPAAGLGGTFSFGYTITDGRGASASAIVSLDVVDATEVGRPPVAVTDVAEVRGGASASFNVVDNDFDPDGDSVTLSDVRAPSGQFVFDPSGEITFTPDPSSDSGTVELEYTITDSFGQTSDGTVRVAIRLDTSNNEPDAVNDTAETVVGKPVTFNVMENDTDPDNDPLTIAGLPELVQSTGSESALEEISLSSDGEFFFLPSVAGDYVFKYSIIDGSERDAAYIRVRVNEPVDNQAPVAVRDDLTVARGDTRNVYVLENDTDPDGDVVGITSWTEGDGLEVEQVQGVGFRVRVLPDAPDDTSFRYSISDGVNDPVGGLVVVAVSDNVTPDQAPITRPDVVEVRAGRTASVRALVNDYDPEGGTLRIVGVSSVEGAQLRIGPGGQEIFVSVDAGVTQGFTFAYDVSDEGDNRTGSIVEVRLVPAADSNRPPVARPDVARTIADMAIDIPVLDNDSDPDGDAIRLESIAAQPVFGTAEVTADGAVRYRPGPAMSGSDRLRYTVVDAQGERAVGEVLIGVLPPDGDNRSPTASNDNFTVIAGSDDVVLDVLANDFDPDGDSLSITNIAGTADGVRLEADTIVFSPPASIVSSSVQQSVTYSIADGRGGRDTALVTIEVVTSAEPIAPVALDDLVGPIQRGRSVDVNVLANDVDPDGRVGDLTISVDDPTLDVAPDGTVSFVDLDETTEVRYTITDPDGLEGTGLVTVIVVDNVAPTVEQALVVTPFETPVTIDVGRLASDADGDDLYFVCCDGEARGAATATESGPGTLVVDFTPDPGYSGTTGFAFTVDDQEGHVVAGSVQVQVDPATNTPPVAVDATVEAEAGVETPISLAAYVTDVDTATGDTLSFTAEPPAAVSFGGSTLVATPGFDAAGQTYEVPYTATDAAGASASARISITVTESNVPAPTAVADTAQTTQETPAIVSVLANDVDPLGEGLTIRGANVPDGSGVATVAETQVVYSPNPGFFGSATFTYEIEDARGTAAGRSSGSAVVTVIGRPGVPSTPRATADNAVATATWTLPPPNGAPLDGIELQVNEQAPFSADVSSSHTFDGLTNGEPYTFRVRAHNTAGWGDWSQPSAPVTPDVIPGRPNSPTVQFGDGQLQVNWTEPANDGSAITGYELEIGGGLSAVQSLGNTTDFLWEGLENGTNYQFRVVARNAAGLSAPSGWSSAEHPLREPDAPGTPVAQRGNRYLDVTWPAAANNGDPVDNYQIRIRSNVDDVVPVGTVTSYRWSDLENGVAQEFSVRAKNRDVDWGEWSAWSAPVVPCTVPDQPAAPSAVRGDQLATITYAAPGDQGCPISAMEMRIAGSSTTRQLSGSPFTFDGLTNGTSYQFEFRAQNDEGWGAWSAASNAVTPAGRPIGPGAVSVANGAPGVVQVDWQASNPNGSAITGYEVSINDGAARGTGSSSPGYRATGLQYNTRYTFKARGCNDVGCGPWSDKSPIVTSGPPEKVSTPNARASDGKVSASWNAPASNGYNIQSYDVEIDPGGVSNQSGTSKSWDVANGRSYRVRVRAINRAGAGPWSNWSQSVTPEAPRNIRVSKGASVYRPGECDTPSCRWVNVSGTGLPANSDYLVRCYSSRDGEFSSPDPVRTNGSGSFTENNVCFFGYPGETVWVFVGPYRSNNTITW